ncbi:MAG TPA: signal peptidase II [Candidatus Magasanikbacteria bacterium]|nr:signal peptidase II [Candidatus Magasanikbacteria bacterium]
MKEKFRLLLAFAPGGIFFVLDRLAKYLSVHRLAGRAPIGRLVGLEYFENHGIAFSIPFPGTFLLIVTPIILFGFLLLFIKPHPNKFWYRFSLTMIVAGALSNYIDRVLYSYTIDYFRLFTSIINLADVSIVVGTIILAFVFFWEESYARQN